MITIKEAIKRSKIFKENGLAEIFERAEKAEEQKKLNETVRKVVDEKENEKEEIIRLKKEKAKFIANFPKTKTFTTIKGETFTRTLYSFEADYPKPEIKTVIFTHGKTNYTLWFLNAKKKVCVVDDAKNSNGNIYLTIMIDVKGRRKKTYMSLDRFLYLIQKGDFKITLEKFNEEYLKDITESKLYKNKIQEFDEKIESAKLIALLPTDISDKIIEKD